MTTNVVIKLEDGTRIMPNHYINIPSIPSKGDTIGFEDELYEVIRINYVANVVSFNVGFFPEIIVKQIWIKN